MPDGIRPTQDKVRKALFDILGDVSGLSFLELYAGSGAVSFEALSRGASSAIMIESHAGCARIIRENMELLKNRDCFVYTQDCIRAISMMERTGKAFDIVFLDPPYYAYRATVPCASTTPPCESLTKKTLHTLGACAIVTPDGFVIAQHHKKDSVPESTGCLRLNRQSRYGDTVLSFYGVYVAEVIVAVAHNPHKKPFFSVTERVDFLKTATAGLDNVSVRHFDGLVVDFARKNKISILIRGVRMLSDFEYEFQMALTNRKLAADMETIFLMPHESFSYISSKLLKEAASLGADISAFVPLCVEKAIKSKLKRRRHPL
jgi:pantetheine-phosphate adenylyltransferase